MGGIVWLYWLESTVNQEYVLTLKEQVEVHVRRAAVLRALLVYLHGHISSFLKTWNVGKKVVDG